MWGCSAHHRSDQRARFLITAVRPAWIAEIRFPQPSLHLSDPDIRASQLELQRSITGRVALQSFEEFQSFGDDGLADRRRAREGRDGVVNLENQRARELSHVVESRHGALALGRGHARLPDRADQRSNQRDQQDARDRKRRPVARDRLAYTITPSAYTSDAVVTGRPLTCSGLA